MTMSGRNAPLSPVSIGDHEWSYPPISSADGLDLNRTRLQLITPPASAGSVGAMNGGFPPGPRSVGGPSPPSSVGRSSTATTTQFYARRDSTRSDRDDGNQEAILGEHYTSLKRYLSSTSRDGRPHLPPNKARDKLQRLTGVQFLELSTDVYDELRRREAAGRKPLPSAPPITGPPPHLMPKESFHPKRNQARQKLASLGSPRFRDLATDVFCELERRHPRFAAGDISRGNSAMSSRGGLPSRTGTPVNGLNGSRGDLRDRRRQLSEASSIRSGRSGPTNGAAYPVPPYPGTLAKGDLGRPMAKQFQSNTIVPNKSTMVEEDDDVASLQQDDILAADGALDGHPQSKRKVRSGSDKKLIEYYESQVGELCEKLEHTQHMVKKKEDEISELLVNEQSRKAASNVDKQRRDHERAELENRLETLQTLNDSLQKQLDRMQDEHANQVKALRAQIDESTMKINNSRADGQLERENLELRSALREQQQVTDEVRREAQEFLREMKVMSEQSSSAWDKQVELEKAIESLEKEVRDWRNRYARAKTQLRNMRASSLGLSIDQDAGKCVREQGFLEDNGLVKDVHVTKFQMAVDELLQRARGDALEKTIDSMKAVVVSIRQITKDLDEWTPSDDKMLQQQAKLKARVSSTANNLITASKTFANSEGISPVSIVDAAASHLVATVVDLLRTVKIRPTPAGELEDDDGSMTPVDSAGFSSPRSRGQSQSKMSSAVSSQNTLPRPPPFQGLGTYRGSAGSSAYSPISSPRELLASKRRGSRGMALGEGNGMSNGNGNGSLDHAKTPLVLSQDGEDVAVLKDQLEDQTAVLVQTIQNLVQLIRGDAAIGQVMDEITVIAEVVGDVVTRAQGFSGGASVAKSVERLESSRQRLLEAGERGRDLAGQGKDTDSREWRMWTQTLPPIAFEIARETKELVQQFDQLVLG